MTIFTRGDKYLDSRYQWGNIPHLFPSWQAGDVFGMSQDWPDKPTGYAVVEPGVVDLDTVEVVKI